MLVDHAVKHLLTHVATVKSSTREATHFVEIEWSIQLLRGLYESVFHFFVGSIFKVVTLVVFVQAFVVD